MDATAGSPLGDNLSQLHVGLHDGFAGDEVVVLVNGQEAYHKQDVQTRYQISRADELVVNVPGESATVNVTLPRRGISKDFQLDTNEPVWPGVSVTSDGRLEGRVSQTRFRYL
jgi:hypothetical protein